MGEGLILYSLRKHRGHLISAADVISTSTPTKTRKDLQAKRQASLCAVSSHSFRVSNAALEADMVQFHICCNLMCLDHPLWNRLDRNMAPFNYLESWHMVLEILIRFFIFYSFWGVQNTADIVSPNNRCAKERAPLCDHVIWKLSMKRNFYLFNNNGEREREKEKENVTSVENISHHCHDTHLTLVHINADVSVHKLHCPQTDSELWMEVMATIAVTSVSSEKHPVEPWKQDLTQKTSTSKPAYTVIRIYCSLLSQERYMICWAFGRSPITSIKHYSALSYSTTWCEKECAHWWAFRCENRNVYAFQFYCMSRRTACIQRESAWL